MADPEAVDLPTAKEAKPPEMPVWTAEELARFLTWGRAHDHYMPWLIKATTGVRRGELLALRWRDVDLDAGTVGVRRSVSAIRELGRPERIEEKGAKTDRPRVINLDAETVAELRGCRRERASLSLALIRPDALVFSDPNGRHLHPDRFSRRFIEAVARCRRDLGEAAPPPIRLHDLRHTHATLLSTRLKAGIPVKVVSERLGHASPMITLTVYAHVMPGMQRQAADTFAAILRPGHQSDITEASGRTL